MFEAHITSTRGSLLYVAQATPYDLDTLRMHVRDFAAANDHVVVEVTVDRAPPDVAVAAVLQDLARSGVETRIRAGTRDRSADRRQSGAAAGRRRRGPLQR
jgi:hypothetical protein